MKQELSYCGLDCESCNLREEVLCEGCKGSDTTYWGGICEIKECARKLQKVENCSQCVKFPCDILLDISFDPETGDEGARIERLKELSDSRVTLWDKIRPPLIGALLGGIAGVIIGAVAENVFSWFVALGGGDITAIAEENGNLTGYVIGCAVIGAAIAIIRAVNRRSG
jgi:hypothetical protein